MHIYVYRRTIDDICLYNIIKSTLNVFKPTLLKFAYSYTIMYNFGRNT